MATSTLTLQTATAASWDTGWTQSAGDTWAATSLVLTVTDAGSVDLELSCRDDDSTTVLYKQSVPWTASGTLTIPLPTPFYGQIRLRGSIQAGGTVAVAISGELPKLTTSPDGSSLVAPLPVVPVSADYSDTASAAYIALPNGAEWIDSATGERIRKIRNQPVMEGGLLYLRKINFQSSTLTSTPTVIDSGLPTLSRGNLRAVIKAGFFNNVHNQIHGKISLGASFTDTATQWISCEVLLGTVVVARMRIDPTLIPAIAANPSGRISDFDFTLETLDTTFGDGSAVNMRAHGTATAAFGPTTGSGTSRSIIGYVFPLEVYTIPSTINWNVDNTLSVRVSASGSGPTIYGNMVRYWI